MYPTDADGMANSEDPDLGHELVISSWISHINETEIKSARPYCSSVILSTCVWYIWINTVHELRHDKTNKMSVRPAKTQISLGIRPVWSESSLSAWRKLGSLATHWALADAQAELSLRWAHTPFWWFCHVAAHLPLHVSEAVLISSVCHCTSFPLS